MISFRFRPDTELKLDSGRKVKSVLTMPTTAMTTTMAMPPLSSCQEWSEPAHVMRSCIATDAMFATVFVFYFFFYLLNSSFKRTQTNKRHLAAYPPQSVAMAPIRSALNGHDQKKRFNFSPQIYMTCHCRNLATWVTMARSCLTLCHGQNFLMTGWWPRPAAR